jgi:transposase InsO family protein
MGVSRTVVSRCKRRYDVEREAGLLDRSSRPGRSPRALPERAVQEICRARRELKLGPHQLSARLGKPRSTIYRVLRREGLSRLSDLDPLSGETIRRQPLRYERERPGELVHLDVKKLRRIPDGGGRRKDPGWYETNTSFRIRGGLRGQDFIHVAVDDHSRVAVAAPFPDERAESAVAFLDQAVRTYRGHGVQVQCVLTDNGSCYRSRLFRARAEELGVHLHYTRPYRPQTNGKAEAFIKTLKREWAYVTIYSSNTGRLQALPPFLRYYNHSRPHTSLGLLPPISRV